MSPSATAKPVTRPGQGKTGFTERIARRIDQQIGNHMSICILACALLCLITFIGYSHAKPATLDEVILMTIARQPGMADILRALMKGIQVDPPVMHTAVHYLFSWFGDTVQVARVPAIVGFVALCTSVTILLLRHVPASHAVAGFFLPYATYIRNRAIDARPYSMMVGYSALAVLCWDRIDNSPNKLLWRAAFTVSLAAALSTHFFSIFLLPALVAGELVRWNLKKRVDAGNVVCFLLGCLLWLLWSPILFGARGKFIKNYFEPTKFINLYDFFSQSVSTFAIYLVVLLIAIILAAAGRMQTAPVPGTSEVIPDQSRGLLAVCAGLLLVPIAGYAIGSAYLGFFVAHYYMVALLGVIIGMPLMLSLITRRDRIIGVALLAGMLLHGSLIIARGLTGFFRQPHLSPEFSSVRSLVPSGEDIVVPSPHDFLEYSEATHSSSVSPLVYLYDIRKPVETGFSNTLDIVFSEMKPLTSARILPFDETISTRDHLYVAIFDRAVQEWQFQYFREKLRARIDWLGRTGGVNVYHVSLAGLKRSADIR